MDSMDLVIKIHKLEKRINGVHGLSMDSMDSKRTCINFRKRYMESMDCLWTPWILEDFLDSMDPRENFHGIHGL